MASVRLDDRDLFAAAASKRVRELPQVNSVTPLDSGFGLRVSFRGGGSATWFLDNAFENVCRLKTVESQLAELDRFVLAVSAASRDEQDWSEAKGDLLPVLRGVGHGAVRGELTGVSFAPFIYAWLAIDTEEMTEFPKRQRLDIWGIPDDTLWAVARENLRKRASEDRIELRSDTLRTVLADDANAPSRLLLPGWLAGSGVSPIAMIPDRETLLLLSGASAMDMVGLADFAAGLFEDAQHPLSPVLYTSGQGGT